MTNKFDTNRKSIGARNIAYLLTCAALILPTLSLFGWLSGIQLLSSLGKDFIPMAPSTGICFMLLALTLFMKLRRAITLPSKVGSTLIIYFVSFYGLTTVIGLVTGLPIDPDRLLFGQMGFLGTHPIGRMAPSTAILFFIFSTALLFLSLGATKYGKHFGWRTASIVLGAMIAIIGLLYTASYGYSTPIFYGANIIPMALPTSMTFLMMGAALMVTASLSDNQDDNKLLTMRDLKIGTQLKVAFAAMLLFVIILGAVSYWQAGKIQEQTEILYNHPLQVRRAIGELKTDILSIRLGTRDLLLAKNQHQKHEALQLIALSSTDAETQFTEFHTHYLGPEKDIDEAYKSFVRWKTAHQENANLALSGSLELAKENICTTGSVKMYNDQLMDQMQVIDDYARAKGDLVYAYSESLKVSLNRQLILLLAAVILLSLLVNFILLNSIRNPIEELTIATHRFHEGDMNARSDNDSKNELGELSSSFNTMVDKIQTNTELNAKVASLTALMLSEYDAKKFFQTTLNSLAQHTGSQMAAIYVLSDDKKRFEHFESIGVDDNARQSFAADRFEGEFGTTLSTRQIQHIRNIPQDTRFIFHTVVGHFIPREILTLPIIADNEVVAIISLISIDIFSKQSILLTERVLLTLTARVEGIMAYHKTKEILKRVEAQNHELETQKNELASQSVELMQQNIELEMQKNQLNEANRLKTNFLSNMSHELRTPLNSVIALSGVLNRKLANQIPVEEYSYLGVIERNGKHLLNLINDILDISRIEAGREELEITKFKLNQATSEVVEMIHPQANQKEIELLFMDAEIDQYITSDSDKCRHILQNLIANAVKFTEKGKVEVRISQSEANMTITVTDTGIGIAQAHLPYIFDEFRQADGSTSRRFGGTGLGLAIAQKYAHLLGGHITVTSTPDVGSAFSLSLPIRYSEMNRIIEPQTNEVESSSRINEAIHKIILKPNLSAGTKTILLVEDSEPAIIQIKDFLEESGYKILVAHDGAQALEIIDKVLPDAMILDLMMPGIDGFEVLKTLREAQATAKIPVLILTAKHVTKEDLKTLKHNNIHQLIQKGDVNCRELQNAVASMVAAQSEPITAIKKPILPLQTIHGKPIVMVVEDNQDNMTTARAVLSDTFKVIEATDGKMAIQMAILHKPNLILMDIELPEIDGIEAFKTIRQDLRLQHIPVIALTASAMTSDRESILAYGFDAYIAKPIDEGLFFKIINDTLYGK